MRQENKLFKFLFPEKFRLLENSEVLLQRADTLRKVREAIKTPQGADVIKHSEEIYRLSQLQKPSLADLMRDSLGLPMIDFVNVDESGLPKHPFKNLSDIERRSYVFSLDQVYTNRNYHEVMDYCINLLGNKAVLAQSEEARHTAGLGIVALKMFREIFKDAHDMAEEFKKNKDGLSDDEALEIISD